MLVSKAVMEQWERRFNSGRGGSTVGEELQQWERRFNSGRGGSTVGEEVQQLERRFNRKVGNARSTHYPARRQHDMSLYLHELTKALITSAV